MLSQLGKHTITVACLYFKKLDDLDRKILEKILAMSLKATVAKYTNVVVTTHGSNC